MASLRIGVVAAGLALILATTALGQTGEATLGAAAATSGRYFGAAIDPDALDEKAYRNLAATQLTSVTPENAMKWELGRGAARRASTGAKPTRSSPSRKRTGRRFEGIRWSGTRNCRRG